MTKPEQDSFYVYLLSNASLDLYPNNTLSRFKVALDSPILLNRHHGWKVALSSVSCHNNIALENRNETTYFFVDCNIINPQLNGRSSIGEFALQPFNTKKARRLEESKKTLVYQSLNTDIVDHIEISLRDDKYNDLKVLAGQPTVVVLHFKKMPTISRDFALTIDSRSDDFPENTVDDFRCNFPLEMSMLHGKNMEVALLSVRYPVRYAEERLEGYGNFVRLHDITSLSKFSPKSNFFSNSSADFRVLLTEALRMPEERGLVPGKAVQLDNVGVAGSTKYDFIPQMLEALNRMELTPENRRKKRAGGDEPTVVYVDEIQGRAEDVEMEEEEENEGVEEEEFQDAETRPVQFENHKDIFVRTSVNKTCILEMPAHFALRLGLEPTIIKHGRVYTLLIEDLSRRFGNYIDLDANMPSTALLYSSMIQPSVVGSGYGNILKIFPFASQKKRQLYHLYEAENLEWHKLSQADFNNIEFALRQGDGAKMPFSRGCLLKNLSMTLLFRGGK